MMHLKDDINMSSAETKCVYSLRFLVTFVVLTTCLDRALYSNLMSKGQEERNYKKKLEEYSSHKNPN